jgi:ABC-type multidrug transport system fused ATPase/permease subunit
MHCSDVLDLIEPIAAGDLRPDDQLRDHLHSCPQCAGAVASAQRLEALLKAMEIPSAPATFVGAVLQRIRRDQWQSEQNVDRLFNVAIVAAVVFMAGALVTMLNVDAALTIIGSVWAVVNEGGRETLRTAAPAVATYFSAAGLLASALVMWWWAERRLQL